jgi:phosphate starvation-inducible protein PhoH
MHIGIFSRDRAARTAARHEQDICVLPVAADVSADYTVRAATVAQNSSASAVSKKDASIAIGPVSDGRQFVGADHEDSVVGM